MTQRFESQHFIEHEGDVIVDPQAMLAPDKVIPAAGLERMRAEELASMHPEFTSQGRDAAATRIAQAENLTSTEPNVSEQTTPGVEVSSKVDELRSKLGKPTPKSAGNQEAQNEEGLLADFNRKRDIVRGVEKPGLPGRGGFHRN